MFRISSQKHSKALLPIGAAHCWNKDNHVVIYTGETRAHATLESVAHLTVAPATTFGVMVISIVNDENLYRRVKIKNLPTD